MRTTRSSGWGPRAELENDGPFDKVLGSAGHFVMPGFVNCHYHSELAIGPGLYQYIYERAHVYVGSALGPIAEQDLYNAILWGLVTAIKGGQTGTVDMFYGRPSLTDFGVPGGAAGLRGRRDADHVRPGVPGPEHDRPRGGRGLPAPAAARAGRARCGARRWALPGHWTRSSAPTARCSGSWHGRQGRIQIAAAPDWTPACSDELYLRCHRLATEHGTGMLTHAVETRSEALFSMERYGKPAVQRLAELGVLGPHAVLEHFVWVTDDEIGMFADSGAVASNNAGSNLRLSSGICRLRDIMAAGGRMAFGTDGISFSDREDFFQELRLACYLQRIPRKFEEARLPSEDVLRAAARTAPARSAAKTSSAASSQAGSPTCSS